MAIYVNDERWCTCDCGWEGHEDDLEVLGADGDRRLCPQCGDEDFERSS